MASRARSQLTSKKVVQLFSAPHAWLIIALVFGSNRNFWLNSTRGFILCAERRGWVEQENDGVVRVSTSKAKTHALRSNKVATLMQVEYILYNDND